MIELGKDPIDATALLARVLAPTDGAQALFLGVVRDHHEGRSVERLEYEAYEPMAQAKLQEIRERALERFDVREIGIAHRLGRLEIGEASVAVVVASSHRGPAFEACRFVMDVLKEEVPIFKKEFYADGTGDRWIEGGTPPTKGA